MRYLLPLVFVVLSQAALSQEGLRVPAPLRAMWEKSPIDFSWTNKLHVTRADSFPVQGYLKTYPHSYLYFSTNSPEVTLLDNGNVYLDFPFNPTTPDAAKDATKAFLSRFHLSFHISQLLDINKILKTFDQYHYTLEDHQVFPISMNLGAVLPNSRLYGSVSKCHIKFTIHLSAEKRTQLLIETGEASIFGDPPETYYLQILNRNQTKALIEMLDALPSETWWGQKAVGIIPSTQTNNTTTPSTSSP